MRAALLLLVACGGGDDPPQVCRPSVLYLNRTGGDYDRANFDDALANRSAILDGPHTLAPYPRDDIDWGITTACIRAALAPFPIEVTETAPATPHVELVFTTAYWGGPPLTYLVPDSCRTDNEVAFVFGGAIATNARACQVAMIAYAQMTAQLSYGANCRDFLDRSMDCVPDRTFTDETVACVDANAQPIACRCGGATTQNTYRALAAAHPACP
jgi:hypothetical protein